MDNWISMLDFDPAQLRELIEDAKAIKAGDGGRAASIRDRILTMVFFNPSLRTRVSFETAMVRHGGHAVCLNVGKDTWNLEYRDGVIMDGSASEHIREAAPVLSRYGHVLSVRSFAALEDAEADAEDAIIRGFAKHATVPVISMESAMEHPCQGMADWLTMAEKLGELRNKRFVLSWAPHIKGLPLAVSHSAVLSAAAAGMHVTVAHPPGYDLNRRVIERAAAWCAQAGSNFEVTHDQAEACDGADVLYVKSWGATGMYNAPEQQNISFKQHTSWTVGAAQLKSNPVLLHCLPVRRNLVLADEALDGPCSAVVDQAENRLWAQAAILAKILQSAQ